MKIAMFTNTFSPHVGGVAHSVSWLAEDLRKLGHRVLIVAPEFAGAPEAEPGVIRVPAIQNFRGSDFSVPIPLSRSLDAELEKFKPEIVHSHHPFLLGGTALRVAASHDLPIVFTYHTRYELYGHYVSQDSPTLQRLVLTLALGYCELCDAVIAPSESIAQFLDDHEVSTPVTVIPTGIDPAAFRNGDGGKLRSRLGIPADAFVVGHVGRLAPEKNLEFLARAVAIFLARTDRAHFVVAGQGPSAEPLQRTLSEAGCAGRTHLLGTVKGDQLADAYASMNVFAFSSHSETQGLVLAEAMAASVPVVALDAPGAREIVSDGRNGRLLAEDADGEQFAEALAWIASRAASESGSLQRAARRTSDRFMRRKCAKRVLDLYMHRLARQPAVKSVQESTWQKTVRELDNEWKIIRNIAHAVGEAVLAPGAGEGS